MWRSPLAKSYGKRDTGPVAQKTIFAGFKPTAHRTAARQRRVAVIAFDGVVLADLATPCELFGNIRGRDGRALYDVRVCSAAREVASAHAALRVPWRLSSLNGADTVIVPGVDDIHKPVPEIVV